MIRLGETYISVMYDYLHKLIYDYHVIQADETPVLVNKDTELQVARAICGSTVQGI